MKTSCCAAAAALLLTACANDEAPRSPLSSADPAIDGGVFVQLFEWGWQDIAVECETVLGPAGYAAVQISPPQEHITGPAWWTRYQPVSYKLESRGGTRAEFADMVRRCAAAGVDIYADAVVNHMAGFPEGTGVAGSVFSEYDYPAVPYGFDDFHHCGRNGDDRIVSYQDLWEVQHCQLGTLDDLDTGKPSVQEKIAAYLDDLLSLGVAGFRMDAAKHISHEELHEILSLVDGSPFVYQEVIDRGGEPINAMDYIRNGKVTEFKFPAVIVEAFELGNLDALTDFASRPGWLPADQTIVFVDNHDTQRGHASSGEVVNYKDGARYDLAVAFMLAQPYGYPMVMSSYEFGDDGQGPPDSSPLDETGGCGRDWVCEHRRNTITKMVGFRKAAAGTELVNWEILDDAVLSFGRGDKGHVVINTSDDAKSADLPTDLPAGMYCDLLTGCGGAVAAVDDEGVLRVTVGANHAVVVHTGTRIGDDGPEALMADWQNSGVIGTLVYWQDVESRHLNHKRHVEIWLPPGYDNDPDKHYRVIYMHDGQNLFDPRLSYTGIDWGVDEAVMRGVDADLFEPAIVVGVWNSPDRSQEYSPWHGAPDYARFLIEELMPRVDAEFRTLTGPDNTSVMGSSMGGLLSYYLVKNHPDVFGACGCVSTHFALAESDFSLFGGDDVPYIVRDIENGDTVPKGVRFYFDYGTETLDATYEHDHEPVRQWFLEQGLVEGQDFQMRKYEGAAHAEAAWRARVQDQLEWLLAGD